MRRPIVSALVATVLLTPISLWAQLPGLPVLQNAFANPGVTVGLNYGRGTSMTGYAAAAAWAPGNARFVASGGIGAAKPDQGESSTAYGGRISAPVFRFMDGAAGVGAFAGYGGVDAASTSVAVIGASVGYRRPLGTLGVSVHAAPSYQRHRASFANETVSAGLFRFSAGVDVSFGERFGATVGFEAGGTAKETEPGPTASVFGLGVSYALRRVQ